MTLNLYGVPKLIIFIIVSRVSTLEDNTVLIHVHAITKYYRKKSQRVNVLEFPL